MDAESTVTETTVDEDVAPSLACIGCGATGPKLGGQFKNKNALSGHMGHCKAYKEWKRNP